MNGRLRVARNATLAAVIILGLACQDRSPTATISGARSVADAAITMGEPTVLSTNDNGNGNLLLVQQASLAEAGTIQSLSFYVAAAAGKLRLGVYDASAAGGGPGIKVAETAEITPVGGWNTSPVLSPVMLKAGVYWLAYAPSSNALNFRMATNGSARWYSRTYGQMPTTFASGASGGSYHWSFYATVMTSTGPANLAPTVAEAAAASPAPATGVSTSLSVLGADDGGEPNLIYRWSTTGTTPVTFAPSGTNAARTSTATFTKAGTYPLRATITDAQGGTATSDVTVVVEQTLTSMTIAPTTATLVPGGTQSFTPTGQDQFGQPMTSAPSPAWAVSGGGTISAAGLFTAGSSAGGPFGVSASVGNVVATASVTVGTTSIVIGEPLVLPNDDNGNGNLVVAQRTTLSQSGTLRSLSFYVTTPAGKLRLGVYDATGPNGGPGAKLAETAEITPTAGWNTPSVSGVTLAAGTYWLAYFPSSNSLRFKMATSGTGRWYQASYGPMPAVYSTSPSSGSYHWSLNATLVTGAAAPPPHLTQVSLTPTSVLMTPGQTQQFTVSGTMSDGQQTTPSVVYSATGGAVTSGGLFTAGSTAGTYQVIASVVGENLADTSAVTVTSAGGSPISALDFPGVTDRQATMRFTFRNPISYPATFIMHVYPRSQDLGDYFTAFFYGNEGPFEGSKDFYGFHPYPIWSSDPRAWAWEIAAPPSQDITAEQVVFGTWYQQAAVVYKTGDSTSHTFYYDFPNTNRVVRYMSDGTLAPPTSPVISVGDAPWNEGAEIWNGMMRGFQFYSAALTPEEIAQEIASPGSSAKGASLWYLNLNPTPTDISDKSGKGNHPTWVGTARPNLWKP